MEKALVLDAYHRGLLSKEECTKILGIDPSVFASTFEEFHNVYKLERYTK